MARLTPYSSRNQAETVEAMRASGHGLRAASGWLILVALGGCGDSPEVGANDGSGAQFVRLDEGAQPVATEKSPAEVESESAPAADRPQRSENPAAPAPPAAQQQAPTAPLPAAAEGDWTDEQRARAALDSGSFAAAARQYSVLLLDGVRREPPEPRERLRAWSAELDRAQRGHRWSRRGAWPSIELTVQPGDSLIAIRTRALAAHPGLLLSTGLIARANELPSETSIRPGDVLRVPTDRASALVDISAMWVLYLLGDEVAASWEVGVGKDTSPTRPGEYTIGLKQKEPMWSPVGREPVPFGDPENPLGTRWLAWFAAGKNTSLGFHGTNDLNAIGRRVSDGCVRMRNPDVELLFEILPRDARTAVQD